MRLAVGGGGDPLQHLGRVVVAGLDAFEVEDREATEPGQRAGEPRVDDRVHGRREDRDGQRNAGEDLRQVHVVGLDRVEAGRERDVLEPVCRAELVDLGAKCAPAGKRARRLERRHGGPLRARGRTARRIRGGAA